MVYKTIVGYGSRLLKENIFSRRFLQKTVKVLSSTNSVNSNMNRLADEKSSYLLQHAGNPVNWFPWGKEAFNKAKSENKMIFLSVGYSTCHWCHVMERESFENEDIASVLNEHFVSIKVDREERPDVDKVYMTFVQATSGQGGWPMSVWLTPDLKPLVGGTYFPPDERYFGRPGFKSVLLQISRQWEANKETLSQQGTLMLDAIMEGVSVTDSGIDSLPGQEAIDKCFDMMEKTYDPQYGGFGKAPKFPQPVNFNFLFRLYATQPETDTGKKSLDMCLHTLTMMAKGGMHDHIAMGFHRYSTDEKWHVPHFEKMLYDQGQLAVSYLDAFQITKHDAYAQTAKDVFEYVNRDLSHPAGGFYSAEDADSLPNETSTKKKEGAFCVWEHAEVQSALSEKVNSESSQKLADVFCQHFCVFESGNVDPLQDPHDELKKKNVLIIGGSVENTAEALELSISETKAALEKCREILYEERQKRPRPHLDDKMLTSWNGLMISAFSRGGQVLSDNQYTDRAVMAAKFIKENMYNRDEHILLRSCYTGLDKQLTQISSPIHGFLDDYAFLIRGLLDLYEATYDEEWLEWAEELQEKQIAKFWDTEGGGFYTSGSEDTSIVIRLKDDQDGAEPSANSVSAMNLLRLSRILQRTEWEDMAARIMKVFFARITKIPMALPEMIAALIFQRSQFKQIIIAGDQNKSETKEFIDCVNDVFMPNKIVYVTSGNEDSYLSKRVPVLNSMDRIDGKTTAYVCENFTCSLPVNNIEDFRKDLMKNVMQS